MLGIDIGGSNTRVIYGLPVQAGAKFWEFRTPKNKKDFEKILNSLPRADKVGVACAGIINGTRVVRSPNIKYLKNFDFKKYFPRVKVINDARAFLRAEMRAWRLNLQVEVEPPEILGITIGTGIGRAFSNRKIKKFEYPESWEKEYQRIRDRKDYNELADYLGEKINSILKKYKAKKVILGGGVLDKKGFYEKLSKRLRVKAVRAGLGKKAGAIGAAMLWK